MSHLLDVLRDFRSDCGAQLGIVAVSGGADSVAMLRALHECGCERLLVAHFNHQLRGTESDDDAAFVRGLAQQLGLPFHLGEANVALEALGENLESTARRLRYEWLTNLATETGAQWIATGHTADDQAETVLHRLIRGTGIQGLRGIAAERIAVPSSAPGVVPIVIRRPMLSVTRGDVLAYLASHNQPFRTDSSNADLAFTRNRIRSELLPLLKTYNPQIVDLFSRLAEQAEDHARFIRRLAKARLAEVEHPRAGPLVILDVAKLQETDLCLVRELLRTVWEREGWIADRMTFHHWLHLNAIIEGALPGADFPGGVHVRCVGTVVQLGRRS